MNDSSATTPVKQHSLSKINKTVDKILDSKDPMDYIIKADVDLVALYRNLNRIALHAKIMAKDRDGDVFELGDDNRSQIMASTLLLELAKHIKDKNVFIANGIFNDPKMLEETRANGKRVLELKKRMGV